MSSLLRAKEEKHGSNHTDERQSASFPGQNPLEWTHSKNKHVTYVCPQFITDFKWTNAAKKGFTTTHTDEASMENIQFSINSDVSIHIFQTQVFFRVNKTSACLVCLFAWCRSGLLQRCAASHWQQTVWQISPSQIQERTGWEEAFLSRTARLPQSGP